LEGINNDPHLLMAIEEYIKASNITYKEFCDELCKFMKEGKL